VSRHKDTFDRCWEAERRVEELEERIRVLGEALTYYANPRRYRRLGSDTGLLIEEDAGKIARKALSGEALKENT
jgi:hypothetical protein